MAFKEGGQGSPQPGPAHLPGSACAATLSTHFSQSETVLSAKPPCLSAFTFPPHLAGFFPPCRLSRNASELPQFPQGTLAAPTAMPPAAGTLSSPAHFWCEMSTPVTPKVSSTLASNQALKSHSHINHRKIIGIQFGMVKKQRIIITVKLTNSNGKPL